MSVTEPTITEPTIVNINFTQLHQNAKLPTKAHDSDLGWDFYCVGDSEFKENTGGKRSLILWEGQSHLFHTGLSMEIVDPNGSTGPQVGMILFDRSGLSTKQQLHRLAGVIDPSYRGEIIVCLINLSKYSREIFEGDKIIQGILIPVIQASAQWTDYVSESDRGSRGFGSSDIK